MWTTETGHVADLAAFGTVSNDLGQVPSLPVDEPAATGETGLVRLAGG